jgi:hypothetical protein
MRKESITNMIDKKIISSLVEGHAIRVIQEDLIDRMNKFCSNIKEDRSVDLLKLLTIEDTESITHSKTKYQIIYIKECQKRVKDLGWLTSNKHRFPNLSNSQVFNLIKLKEKLSEENALPF